MYYGILTNCISPGCSSSPRIGFTRKEIGYLRRTVSLDFFLAWMQMISNHKWYCLINCLFKWSNFLNNLLNPLNSLFINIKHIPDEILNKKDNIKICNLKSFFIALLISFKIKFFISITVPSKFHSKLNFINRLNHFNRSYRNIISYMIHDLFQYTIYPFIMK